MRQVLLSNTSSTTLNTGSANYVNPNYGGAPSTTSASVRSVFPRAGVLSNLFVKLATAPGASKSWTIDVLKNGVATGIQVVISGSDTQGSDTLHNMIVAAGDVIQLRYTPAGTPAATLAQSNMIFENETPDESIVCGMQGTNLANSMFNSASVSSSAGRVNVPVALAGTFKQFYVDLSVAPGVGNSRTYSISKNGVATGVSVTIADNATTGSDLVNTFTVAPGDVIRIDQTSSGTPASTVPVGGIVFNSDTDYQYLIGSAQNNTVDATATYYGSLSGIGPAAVSQTQLQNLAAQRLTLKSMVVALDGSPTAGKSYAFTVQKNGSNTGLSASVADAATTGSDTDDVTFSDFDSIEVACVPTGTPTARRVAYSFAVATSNFNPAPTAII